MSNAPHTEAPWSHGAEFEPRGYGLQNVISVFARGAVIAHVNCGFGNGLANAALLAALERIRDDYLLLDEVDVRRIADAAIAAATILNAPEKATCVK